MPRAALLSIHARVTRATSASWEHPSLVQIWGPRFSDYVIAAKDLAIFTLGRLPDHAGRRNRVFDTAARLHTFLEGRRMPFGQAGQQMKVPPNSLRYAACSGSVLMRWDGFRQPVVWTVPPPLVDPLEARLELARRYLHIFGPATPPFFAHWAGIGRTEAIVAFRKLAPSLIPVRTPIGDAWVLAQDEQALRSKPTVPAPARFLPSGDAYQLLWGADRGLLVTGPRRTSELWTSRVWPGGLLLNGEIAGVWRRSQSVLSLRLWRKPSKAEWEAVEAEASTLPLPEPITLALTN